MARATKSTTKTPRASKSDTIKVKQPVIASFRAVATEEQLALAMFKARVAMREQLPELHAKYGSPTIPEGDDPSQYEESTLMRDEYLDRRFKLATSELSARGLAVKSKLSFMAGHNSLDKKEQAQMSKTKKAEKAEQKPAGREPKHEYVTTPHGEFRKGSVLHAIYRSWDLKGGATKEEILNRLCEEFGEERRDAMRYTVNTQTGEMPGKRGFELGRDENGRYGLHIKGRFSGRVMSAEQRKAKEEKLKAKEARLAEKAAKKAEKEKAAADKAKAKAAEKAKEEKANAAKAAKLAANKEKAAKKGITLNVPGEVVSA